MSGDGRTTQRPYSLLVDWERERSAAVAAWFRLEAARLWGDMLTKALALPRGVDITFLSPTRAASGVYEATIDACKEAIAIALLGPRRTRIAIARGVGGRRGRKRRRAAERKADR